jgi:4-amino-4-deoxy-L-arabinose transferase-like glycosyltransferase
LTAGARTAWTAAIAVVGVVVRLPLILQRHEIRAGGDSGHYVELGVDFFEKGFSGPLSVDRPPGYPLFLALCDLLPGRVEDAATVAQLLLGAGLAAAVTWFAWPLLGAIAAVVAGALTAITAPGIGIEAVLLADATFGMLVTVACGLLVAAVLTEDARRRLGLLAGVGLAIAAAAYVKPVGHALLVAPVVPLALATRSLRATAAGTAVVTAVALVATVPWMVRNAVEHGSFGMSDQSGATLTNRAFELEKLPPPTDKPYGRDLARFIEENPRQRPSSGFRAELEARGLSSAEADEVQRELAVTAMRREPVKVLGGVARSLESAYTSIALGGGDADVDRQLAVDEPAVPRALTEAGVELGQWLRRAWLLLSLGGLATLAALFAGERRARLAIACVAAVWLSVALATAVLHGGRFRYSAALAPEVYLLGSAGLGAAIAFIRRRTAARSATP